MCGRHRFGGIILVFVTERGTKQRATQTLGQSNSPCKTGNPVSCLQNQSYRRKSVFESTVYCVKCCSGLLSAITSPRGLTFREPFISGTREPVKGYYTASCCAPEVELSVEDADGNRRTDKFNVHSRKCN